MKLKSLAFLVFAIITIITSGLFISPIPAHGLGFCGSVGNPTITIGGINGQSYSQNAIVNVPQGEPVTFYSQVFAEPSSFNEISYPYSSHRYYYPNSSGISYTTVPLTYAADYQIYVAAVQNCDTSDGVEPPSASLTITLRSTPPPSGSISSSNCTIASGASTCNSSVSWSVTNPTAGGNTAVTTPSGITVGTGNSGTVSYAVGNETRNFFLYHNGVELAQSTATGSCVSDAPWDGSKCAPPPAVSQYLVSTSVNPTAGGSISPGSRTVTQGNTTTFTVTQNPGYSISSVTGCGGYLSGSTYTTGAITGACTVSATFSSAPTITPLSGTCEVSSNPAQTGQKVTWKVIPSGGLYDAGIATYSFNWSGTDSLSGTGYTVDKTYSTSGTKYAYVTITSGSQTFSPNCPSLLISENSIDGLCSIPPTPPTHYSCAQGTSENNVNGSSAWTWTCAGSNGGSPALCSESKAPTCATTHYNCATGNSINNVDDYWEWKWSCSNGSTSVACTEAKSIVGSCSSTHYGCTSGASWYNTELSDRWTWTCVGSTKDDNFNCVEMKPTGSVSSTSCTIPSGASTGSSSVSWSVTNPTAWANTAVTTPSGITVGTGNSGTVSYAVGNETRNFYLYHNGALLSQSSATCSCASGSSWDGSKCTSVIIGSCGSSSGGNFYSAPTSGLCGSGTASAVSGSGPWTWSCAGSNGGASASCLANKKVDGGWSEWSAQSTQCGYTGTQTRTCTNPSPANGGADCSALDGGNSTRSYTTAQCLPTLGNVTISSPTITPDDSTKYTIKISGSHSGGVGKILVFQSVINLQGENAGNYRGYLIWNAGSASYWPGSAKTGSTQSCSGSGSPSTAIIYGDYGYQYLNLKSCSVSDSGNTRTVSFEVTFEPAYTTPSTNNDISGLVYDDLWQNDGWKNFDINFSLNLKPDLTAGAVTPTTAQLGTPVTFSSPISNIGTSSTPSSITHLFQYDDDEDHNSIIGTGTGQTTVAIAPGGAATVSHTTTFSSMGSKYVRACADLNSSYKGTVTESNEENNCGPWTVITVGHSDVTMDSINIAPLTNNSISPDGQKHYSVTHKSSDTFGGSNVAQAHSLINLYGTNAGMYRGYLIWYYDNSYPRWDGLKDKLTCSGVDKGIAAIYDASSINYGHEYLELHGCTSSVLGNTRTITFDVTFNPNYSTPSENNDIAGYVANKQGKEAGPVWKNFDINFALDLRPNLGARAPTPTSVTAGQVVTYNSSIFNIGDANASGNITHRFEFDEDANHTNAPAPAVNNPTTNEIIPINGEVPISTVYAFQNPGTRYVRACADNNASWVGTVSESNESDNCSDWTSVTVNSACVVTMGNDCTSASNSCGNSNRGSIQCDGTCSAITPEEPAKCPPGGQCTNGATNPPRCTTCSTTNACLNGATNPEICTASPGTLGVCSSTCTTEDKHYTCYIGTPQNLQSSPSGWTWECKGTGPTATQCSESKKKPVFIEE